MNNLKIKKYFLRTLITFVIIGTAMVGLFYIPIDLKEYESVNGWVGILFVSYGILQIYILNKELKKITIKTNGDSHE